MTDMATMPIRELIDGLREKADEAIERDQLLVHGLLFKLLANRLEEQQNELDQLRAVREIPTTNLARSIDHLRQWPAAYKMSTHDSRVCGVIVDAFDKGEIP